MRITIIPSDKSIGINGEFLSNIREDLSWIPQNIHAVQWYDTWGEIEYNDGTLNQKIENLDIYQQALINFDNEKIRIENEKILIEQQIEASRDYWKELRTMRNSLLANSDWTQLPDSPLSIEKRQEWQVYRQDLRDLTDNIEDPKPLVIDLNHLSWPVRPA